VALGGTEIALTPREFGLLAHLAREPERIFTRDQLLGSVWGHDFAGDDRTVDVHISWLRRKLRGDDGHDWFRAVRGVGYALSPPPQR
jgi:DNA-binding response OmpR family regulator